MRSIRVLRAGLLLGAFAGIACSETPTRPAPPESFVSFDYSGGEYGGTFSASGAPREDGTLGGSYAMGYSSPSSRILVFAFEAGTGTLGDRLILLAPTTIGTHPIDMQTFWGYLGMDAALKGVPPGVPAFHLQDGTITITELTDSRIRGSFEGHGSVGLTNSSHAEAFTVANGRFDLALRPMPVDY